MHSRIAHASAAGVDFVEVGDAKKRFAGAKFRVKIMQDNGLVALAGHDDDFDRVPGIMDYAPA
ncbi:MAG TPA: hypothetical protein VKS79_06235 [Gemmataceae bacterium]|nr:hypothetical protein [Gemmataceae bacterium]